MIEALLIGGPEEFHKKVVRLEKFRQNIFMEERPKPSIMDLRGKLPDVVARPTFRIHRYTYIGRGIWEHVEGM